MWRGGGQADGGLPHARPGCAPYSALDLAAQQGIHSIAFPAISTGRFSYPKQAATRIAVQAVRDWKKQHPQAAMQVIFFCADMGIYNGFLCALQAEERGIEK